MKRFMKCCGITALIFAALGIVLAVAGGSIAGKTKIAEVMESATGGRVRMEPFAWWTWRYEAGDRLINAEIADISEMTDWGWAESAKEVSEEYETVRDEDPMFSRKHDIITGSRDKYCPGDGIQKLDIEIAGCWFNTEESYDGHIYLEVNEAYRFQAYVKEDTLHIKAKTASASDWADGGSITLYIPAGYRFADVEVELGAGDFSFTNLIAAEASLEVGAGQISIQNVEVADLEVSVAAGYIWLWDMQVTNLDAEVGMGAFSADGIVNGNVDVECSMGSVEMMLEGREQDFDYCLEGAMGTIELGSNTYGGLAEERDINNHAGKMMDIECSMGNVAVTFTD